MDVRTRYTQYTQSDAEACVAIGVEFEYLHIDGRLPKIEGLPLPVERLVDIARSWCDEHTGKFEWAAAIPYFRERLITLWGGV